jgi:hypothetical protein
VQDDQIGMVVNAFLDLNKRQKLEHQQHEVEVEDPRAQTVIKATSGTTSKKRLGRSKPPTEMTTRSTTRSPAKKLNQKQGAYFPNVCEYGCNPGESEIFCTGCILHGRVKTYTTEESQYHLPPGMADSAFGNCFYV